MQVHVGSSPVIRTMSLLQMQKAHFLCTPLFFYKNRADPMIRSVYLIFVMLHGITKQGTVACSMRYKEPFSVLRIIISIDPQF